MSRTVDDLLTLADVDRGLVLAREDLDLLALVRAVVGSLDAMAAARGVTVAAAGEPLIVHADPDRLRHAIRNVVDNAIGFSPPGGTVTVTVEPCAGGGAPAGFAGGGARVVVEDEGPGIPAEHRAAVFDRFHRADPSRTRATGGSGLGLAITRDIVRAHGGAVHASAGARGARVSLEVPATTRSEPVAASGGL